MIILTNKDLFPYLLVSFDSITWQKKYTFKGSFNIQKNLCNIFWSNKGNPLCIESFESSNNDLNERVQSSTKLVITNSIEQKDYVVLYV